MPLPADPETLRADVRALCTRFPDAYWRERDQLREHPSAFVQAMTDAGYLAALIPTAYGCAGLGVFESSIHPPNLPMRRQPGRAPAGR